MDRETELALVRGLREGDRAAFDVVYDEFRAGLYGFLARLSRRRDVAEDLLEETWLRLVAHARRLRPDTRLGPWLFTVARNLYCSYCRSRLLELEYTTGVMGPWNPIESRPSPFEHVAADELERRIESALSVLPVRYREVLLLVGVAQMKPSEAADVCGITPEALRQRLSRARSLLARELDKHGKCRT